MPGLSMSILYFILTVLPSTMDSLCLLECHREKRLTLKLHQFFSLAFWWPSAINDGMNAWDYVHRGRMDSYHRALKILSANFVKSVDRFIKSNPQLSSHVDRPNLHRILELAHHTIPLFNNVRYLCELVFESSHQPLKFYLWRNHTTNSHVYSVQVVFAKDWLDRLWSLWRLYRDKSEAPEHRRFALIGLLRLFGGKEMDDVDWTMQQGGKYIDELRDHVNSLMIGTIEERLDTW